MNGLKNHWTLRSFFSGVYEHAALESSFPFNSSVCRQIISGALKKYLVMIILKTLIRPSIICPNDIIANVNGRIGRMAAIICFF